MENLVKTQEILTEKFAKEVFESMISSFSPFEAHESFMYLKNLLIEHQIRVITQRREELESQSKWIEEFGSKTF